MGLLVFGVGSAVSSLIVFITTSPALISPAISAIVAFIYLMAIKNMLFQYGELVLVGLTLKEKVSRMQTCMTYKIDDDFRKVEKLSFAAKLGNAFRILCKKRHYKSSIPSPAAFDMFK